MKRRVLVVGAINRPDILSMFRVAKETVELRFLEYRYNWGDLVDESRYRPYGSVTRWDQYADAYDLLERERPDTIAFFYITSFNQIALRVAARTLGIRTLHLEHGHRLRFEQRASDRHLAGARRRRLDPRRLRRELPSAVRNHAFFFRSAARSPSPLRRELLLLAASGYARGMTPALLRKHGRLRQPDEYLAFSPETFEYHRVQDAVDDLARPVTYIGIPYFDALAGIRAEVEPKGALLVDHQFHEGGLFGWTLEYRRAWVKRLHGVVRAARLPLLVKLHPGDRSDAWRPYLGDGVELVEGDDLRGVIATTRVVLGTFSTMQLPLAAFDHTALITLEIHPEKGPFPSRGFVEAGVADVVFDFDELADKLRDIDGLHARQRSHKASYVSQFLHSFDGRAGERLAHALSGATIA